MWSGYEEIRLSNKTDDIIKGLINSFLNKYQNEEVLLRNGSKFIFESVDLLTYHIQKTSPKRESSYIKSSEWILDKKATMNLKNEDDYCFGYSVIIALHDKNLKSIQKEYQEFIIIFFWNIIGKEWSFQLE